MEEELDRKIAELEQRLFDERRERDAAQRRASDLSESVDIWRTRAEERAVRIKKLEAERDKLRGVTGWLRRQRPAPTRQVQPTLIPDAPADTGVVAAPLLPAIRCVTALASSDLAAAAGSFDAVALDASVSLMEPDVVLVDAEGFRQLPDDLSAALIEWASVSGRPPLVVTSDTPSDVAQYAQSVLDADDVTGRFFSPSQYSPLTRSSRDPHSLERISVDVEGFGLVVAEPF
ncbi:MAG: hypothetical protein ABFR53_13435, partial [Actinomycetota bacterium]